MKIGIYPGSFNPFHAGHNNIHQKSLNLFDRVIVNRLINPDKKFTLDEKLPNLPDFVESRGNLLCVIRTVIKLEKVESKDIFIIRGFRNLDDIKYQQEQDYWLKEEYPDFQSVYIKCDKEFEHVSSTAIKQMREIGMDTIKLECYEK